MQTGNNPPENYFVQARIPYFKEQAFKVTSQEPLFRKIIATWGKHAQVKLIDILEGEYGQVIEVPLLLIQGGSIGLLIQGDSIGVQTLKSKIRGNPIFLKKVPLSYRQQMDRFRRQIAAKTENQQDD